MTGPLSDTDKTVPGSPRPSILRKRPDSEAAVVTPVKGAILTISAEAGVKSIIHNLSHVLTTR